MSDAERGVIGCILVSEAPILSNLVAAGLQPFHFADASCRSTFEIMTELGAGKANDIALVSQAARERGERKDFGVFLSSLLDHPPVRQEIECAKLVIDAYRRRELLRALTAASGILAGDAGLDEAVAILSDALKTIAVSEPRQLVFTPKDLLPQMLLSPEAPESIARRGVSTGFHALDEQLQGIRPQQLLILGGRPGMGKTICAQNIAENAAMAGKRVLFFSLEMDPIELTERYLASQATLPYSQVRARILTDPEKARVLAFAAIWTDRLVWHRGTRNMAVNDIVAHARAIVEQRGPLDLVVVDYLGKLRPRSGGQMSLNERVGEIASDLKNAARELDLPFLVVQQLNRAVEGRPQRVPTMSDLRDSGVIEQEADIIILLGDEDGSRSDIKAFIAKNRNGRIGAVQMIPEFQYQRFAR